MEFKKVEWDKICHIKHSIRKSLMKKIFENSSKRKIGKVEDHTFAKKSTVHHERGLNIPHYFFRTPTIYGNITEERGKRWHWLGKRQGLMESKRYD